MRERRRDHRFNLSGQIRLNIAGREFESSLADISVSGVSFLLDTPHLGFKPSGAVGSCIIESPMLRAPVTAFVSVMRIRRIGRGQWVGLRFESIDDANLAVIRELVEGRG